MDRFHHSSKITLTLECTGFNIDQTKKFFGINKIEIAGKCKIPCRNCIALYKRMAKFDIVLSLCSIAQVTEKNFSQVGDVSFHQSRMLCNIRLIFFKLFYFLTNLLELSAIG